jgi:MFS family permease
VLTREFYKLWVGQSISAVGSAVTQIALPLTAALTLGASAQQMGILVAAGWLPYLLFALFAGVWADRLPRKPILVVTDLARAAILVSIPLAAFVGVLTIEHVLAAAFLAGAMTVLFRSAYGPFIPTLVGRDLLVDANAKLALSDSAARVVGPSLGGLLVQLVTAPFAILLDAVSFLVSAIAVIAVRVRETPPPVTERRGMWTEIWEGIRFTVASPFVRAVMVIGLLFNVSITIGDAVFVLYATRSLGLDGALLGAVYTVSGIASVAAGYLALRGALAGFAAALFNVTTAVAYQSAVPDRLMGRVGGASSVVGLGLIPVSAVLGGFLGETIGLWNTLAVSIGAQFVSFVYVALSPLRGIRTTSDLAVTEAIAK